MAGLGPAVHSYIFTGKILAKSQPVQGHSRGANRFENLSLASAGAALTNAKSVESDVKLHGAEHRRL